MRKAFPLLIATAFLSACATASAPVGPIAHPVAIDMSHYSGTWLEIARHPMLITHNCVAGYTTYTPQAKPGSIAVEDGCHDQTPDGRLKVIHGSGRLLDAGAGNARLRVMYPFLITFNYWVLYEAPDHSWFISSDPDMHNLWIYSRTAPSNTTRAAMVQEAQNLGYDITQLEFPPLATPAPDGA